jgi:hypothetical protein
VNTRRASRPLISLGARRKRQGQCFQTARMSSAKRRRDADDDEDRGQRPAKREARGAAASGDGGAAGEGTVGQRTSGIRNKQRRSEVYHQLKHKAAVRVIGDWTRCI